MPDLPGALGSGAKFYAVVMVAMVVPCASMARLKK
jgi:hypothetical protein